MIWLHTAFSHLWFRCPLIVFSLFRVCFLNVHMNSMWICKSMKKVRQKCSLRRKHTSIWGENNENLSKNIQSIIIIINESFWHLLGVWWIVTGSFYREAKAAKFITGSRVPLTSIWVSSTGWRVSSRFPHLNSHSNTALIPKWQIRWFGCQFFQSNPNECSTNDSSALSSATSTTKTNWRG